MTDWWNDIDAVLGAHSAPEVENPPQQRSSVAAILDFRPDPHVLLMRRVVYERDPWSGHVSLPGGRSSEADADLLATAIRETREEVDIDLGSSASLLGQLTPRQAISRGRRHEMDVTPFIFKLEEKVRPTPMEEAEALFWLPLERAASGELADEHSFERDNLIHRTPCWKFEEFVVWGMTYRILTNLLTVCRRL